MNTLCTIGYEGATLDDFIATLRDAGVSIVVDVRALAISRRKGFAKSALRAALDAAGIAYRHEPRLGTPKPLRERLKRDGDYAVFFQQFGRHLADQDNVLSALTSELDNASVALMCFERDPCQCHRSAVASRMAELTQLQPCHLGVHHGRHVAKGTHLDTRQSVSSAEQTL